jgi:hypothetical protein
MATSQTVVAGRYLLIRQIGRGGMGRVWLARDELLGRDVAVKEIVLPDALIPEEREEQRLRMLREARAAARLNHPNAVRVYDVLRTRAGPWIVMEYLPSRSLHEILRDDGPVPVEQAVRIGLAMLAALRAAHGAGVVHRDVKPANVLIGDDGRIALTDFGLATFDGGDGVLTQPGLVLGSPQFIAPERVSDGVSTPEADLWSLGATLFAAVEGKAPYARSTAFATLTALATERPPRPRSAGPLRPVIQGLLKREPRARLSAAQAERMLRRAAAVLAGRQSQSLVPRPRPPADSAAPHAAPPARRRVRTWWVPVAALALLVTAVAAVTLRPGRGPTPPGAAPPATTAPAGGPASGGPASGVGGGAPAGTPVPSVPPRADEYALPEGWTWHRDPDGFRVAAPVGWLYRRDGATATFREPGGDRVLAVTRSAAADGPTAPSAERERRLLAAGGQSGYERLRMEPVTYFGDCVEWEYRHDGPAGARLHSTDRHFAAPGGVYVLTWTTRDFDWRGNLANLLLVVGGFRPPPG